MKLQAVITDLEHPDERQMLEAEEAPILLAADTVDGWGTGTLSIRYDHQARTLRIAGEGLSEPLTLGDDTTTPERMRSGETLRVGERWSIRVFVRFASTGQRRRAGLVPGLVLVGVAVLMLFQLGMGIWLPLAMEQETRFGTEVARQRTLQLMDFMRYVVLGHLEADHDASTLATLALTRDELDRLAAYLRLHDDALGATQINHIHNDLVELQSFTMQLLQGQLYPEDQDLDVESAIFDLVGDGAEERPTP